MNTFLIALGIIVFLIIVIAAINYFGKKSKVKSATDSVPPVNNLTYETVPTRTVGYGNVGPGSVGVAGVSGASAGAGARVSGGKNH